jgi:RNA polymerase sigma-70 factor, ECF subfamily
MDQNNEVNNIYDAFGRQLQAYICHKVKHHDDCYDIMQNVYVKVFNKPNLVRQADRVAPYLFRIASNEVINHYRSSFKYQPFEALAGESILADNEAPSFQYKDICIRTMIYSLPPVYRDALLATDLGDLSQKALAEKLGISVSAAKSRVQRAREKLKKEILKHGPYEFDRYGNIISCCEKN